MLVSKKTVVILLSLMLQFFVPSAAGAAVDNKCAYVDLGEIAPKIKSGTPNSLKFLNNSLNAALEKVQSNEYALSCMRLLQNEENNRRESDKLDGRWSLIIDDRRLTNQALFGKCNSLALCKTSQTIADLLSGICSDKKKSSEMAINIAPDDCAKIKKTPWPLSPARRGIGGSLVVAGGVIAILGFAHLLTPVFATDDGCVVAGLRHPCSADRFGVGGALLGSGLAVLGGGLLTLTLPARGK